MTFAPVRHGGKALVEALEAQGVRRIFCVPGESYLPVLDGFYESEIETVIARHEGGATMMADAHGKLTGKPGIAFVTRGPGATNASSGVHVAFQDSTPMVLFIGQVASDQRDREAFQEVDFRAMFGPLSKRVLEIDSVDRIPEYVSQAFHVAQAGRPGPVVVSLPENVLSAPCDAAIIPQAILPSGEASENEVHNILHALRHAERPFILVGGGCWSAAGAEALGELAERLDLPVGVSFRCQDFFDNRHPCYAGDVGIGVNPILAERVRQADVLLCLGARLGELTTSGYTLLGLPLTTQTLIHVHADANEPGRVYYPDMSIAARADKVALQLAEASRAVYGVTLQRGLNANAAYKSWLQPEETPGELKLEQVVGYLNTRLDDNAIVTNGAGNYAGWLNRYFQYKKWRTQLAPTSGSMGYGLPAAVAAKLEHPERDVVCMAGDGCFQMTAQEFGTAIHYNANIVVLVSNNGMYGTIRMHQHKNYPERPSGTDLVNPDFAAFARAYGGHGETVTRDDEFPDAFERARSAGTPAIIDLKVSPLALSTKVAL